MIGENMLKQLINGTLQTNNIENEVLVKWIWFFVAFLVVAAWLFCMWKGYARWTVHWSWNGIDIGCAH